MSNAQLEKEEKEKENPNSKGINRILVLVIKTP
jgi:hypothetical protein